MRFLIISLMRMVYHQLRNIFYWLRGIPVVVVPLGSVTLDEDDVSIAQQWLGESENWYRTNEVKQYETRFAEWNGSKYAFSFMAGRVALSALIYALDLKQGDEVIIPGYTCVVVPNAFQYAGIKVIYSDIELDTYGLDASLLEEKITPNTKVIMLHHLYGLVSRDYEEIIRIARHHNLYVIEDCAHSTGAEYKGKKVGNFGDVAFYTSEQSKIFNTIQGGIAITNNDQLAKRILEFQKCAPYPDDVWIEKQLYNVLLNYNHFKHPQRWWRGDFVELKFGNKRLISTTKDEERGVRPAHYGRKMPAPIAALGINQLSKIDIYNEKRRRTAKQWDKWCDVNGYKKPLVIPDSLPVYLRYPVMVEPEKKQDVFWARKELGVELGVWFVSNAHPATWVIESCPNSDKAVERCINFPTSDYCYSLNKRYE